MSTPSAACLFSAYICPIYDSCTAALMFGLVAVQLHVSAHLQRCNFAVQKKMHTLSCHSRYESVGLSCGSNGPCTRVLTVSQRARVLLQWVGKPWHLGLLVQAQSQETYHTTWCWPLLENLRLCYLSVVCCLLVVYVIVLQKTYTCKRHRSEQFMQQHT